MIHLDQRISGQIRYVLTDKPEELMQIPQEIKKSVAFLAIEKDGEKVCGGTVFFVRQHTKHSSHIFAVTSKHAFEKLCGPEEVYVRVNFKDGSADWVTTQVSDWLLHPTGPSVDIAIRRFPFRSEFDHRAFPLYDSATPGLMEARSLAPGSQVFLPGLFISRPGKKRNIPIIRVGNIAALPEEKIKTTDLFDPMDAYLVEVHSIEGLSGSPVFVYFEETNRSGFSENVGSLLNNQFPTEPLTTPRFYLIGQIHGHWDTKETLNTGIAIVVPVEKLIETLSHPKILAENERIENDRETSNRATLD